MFKAEQGLVRLLIPFVIGTMLYVFVYILHYFNEMDSSWLGFFILTLPVILVFEIDHQITRYYQRKYPKPQGFFKSILLPFLLSLAICLVIVFAMYIPFKNWEIRNGSVDSIGLYHITSIGIQIFLTVVIANTIHQIIFLVRRWKEEAVKSEQLKKENVKARLRTLRNQISPHFLFNNFNTLYGLIDQEPQQAKAYLHKLSELYRQVLAKRNEELISLEEELETLEAYLYLIRVRFPQDIEIELTLEEQKREYHIPPMSLQMLVENAIKHNAFDEDHPLKIHIEQRGDQITVHNSRQEKEDHTPSMGIGLENIDNRYQLLSDRSIKIEENPSSYRVIIPLLKISGIHESKFAYTHH
ncbi:MAG: histidine kinase [Bacteroidia bacterium]|nr:histidine kinase [Bacteroidia bacterium]